MANPVEVLERTFLSYVNKRPLKMPSLQFVGVIHTPLKNLADCPLQESEGAPEATIDINQEFLPAIRGLERGAKVILMTCLDKADRSTLTTKPRNNPNAETTGVFATRSPDRPNPVGLHQTEIISISEDGHIKVSNLEVLDGTPLVDIKPVI